MFFENSATKSIKVLQLTDNVYITCFYSFTVGDLVYIYYIYYIFISITSPFPFPSPIIIIINNKYYNNRI